MEFRPDALAIDQRYKLLTGLVVPRPIAWVSSIDARGRTNLAPFSYFSIVGHSPMALSFSVAGRKPDRGDKDTLRNVRPVCEGGTGEFVVSVVSRAMAKEMAGTAAPLAAGVSEFQVCGVSGVPASVVRGLRVAAAPASFECRTVQIVQVGIASVVIGEIVCLHVAEGLLDNSGRVRFDGLHAVGRLAGTEYIGLEHRFELEDAGFFPAAPGYAKGAT
jgi:flavin reductase (DIM6/NTAB) family NADH-FMN oxidoreductase RutF